MYYIEIGDLVANALIEMLEHFKKTSISFDVLDRYGNIVVRRLRREKKDVVTLYSRDATEQFFHDYTNYFYIEKDVISLKPGVTVDTLKNVFRENLAFDLFMAFISDEAIRILEAA